MVAECCLQDVLHDMACSMSREDTTLHHEQRCTILCVKPQHQLEATSQIRSMVKGEGMWRFATSSRCRWGCRVHEQPDKHSCMCGS
jgi:hypothetical protein